MILSYSSIIPYIINQLSFIDGQVDGKSIKEVDDNFTKYEYEIEDLNYVQKKSRNRCFTVKTSFKSALNFFLKQPNIFSKESNIQSLREYYFYQFTKEKSFDFLAKMLDYNEQTLILILEWIENAKTLSEGFDDIKNDLANFEKIRDVIHGFHAGLNDEVIKISFESYQTLFGNIYPDSVFNVASNPEQRKVQRILQKDIIKYLDFIDNTQIVSFEESQIDIILDQSRYIWNNYNYSYLIHGDLKASNILLAGSSINFSVKIIDFEKCMFGPPSWDFALLLFSFLLKCKQSETEYDYELFKKIIDTILKGCDESFVNEVRVFIRLRLLIFYVEKKFDKFQHTNLQDTDLNNNELWTVAA